MIAQEEGGVDAKATEKNELAGASLGELAERCGGYSFEMGRQAGMKQAADNLRILSGTYFAEGKDEEAKAARKMANILSDLEKGMREYYNATYAEERAKVWAEVDRREKAEESYTEHRDAGKGR